MVKAVDGKKVSQYYAGEKITCLGAPKLSSVKNYTSSVKINWNKVSSAEGYYVYRKTGTGSYKKIATVKGYKKVSYQSLFTQAEDRSEMVATFLAVLEMVKSKRIVVDAEGQVAFGENREPLEEIPQITEEVSV